MEHIIIGGIVGGITVIILRYMQRNSTEAAADMDEGRYQLRMNKLYGWFGYSSIVLGISLGTAALVGTGFNTEGFLLFLGFNGLFGGLGIPLALIYKDHKAEFDEDELVVTNISGKEKTMVWDEIIDVKFSAFTGFVKLISEKDSIKLHYHLKGLATFVDFLEQKTKWTAKSIKLPIKR